MVCKYRNLAIKGDKIHICLEISDDDTKIEGLVMTRSGSSKTNRTQYFFPMQKIHRGSRKLWKAEIALGDEKFSMVEWGITCRVSQVGVETDVPCIVTDRLLRKKFYLCDRNMKYINRQGEIYFLYLTVKSEVLLIHRPQCIYDSGKYQRREFLAKVCYTLTRRYWDRKNIWIFFEKQSRTAQDNGYYFFQYCMEHQTEKELEAEMYFVLDSHYSSKRDLEKIDKKHMLDFYSFRHMIYLQAAKLLVSSESREQAVVWRNRNSLLRNMLAGKHLFFLQHGVIGLKQLPNFQPQSEGTCDVFIASSVFEKNLVSGSLGYDPEHVAVTGLARYDHLEDRSRIRAQRMIVVMPTWREWLDDVSEEEFRESEFYRNYQDLVTDREIQTFLEEENICMLFCPHPKAQKYGALFQTSSELVQIISYQDVELNQLLMECSLLVTDYSSVSWDAYYMDKPVIFYQFDSGRYLERHGSYLDFSRELFGDRAEDIKGLKVLLKKYQERQFRMDDKYREQKQRYFAYLDRENCKRIYERLKAYCGQ